MLFSLVKCAWYAIFDALVASFIRYRTPQTNTGLFDFASLLSISELALYLRLRSFFASSSAPLLPIHSNGSSPIPPTDIYTSHSPTYIIPRSPIQSHSSTSVAELTPGLTDSTESTFPCSSSRYTSSSGAVTPSGSSNQYYHHLIINPSNSRESSPSFKVKEDDKSKPFIFDPFYQEEDICVTLSLAAQCQPHANFVFSPFDLPDDEALLPSSDIADSCYFSAALAIQVSENVLANDGTFFKSKDDASDTPSCAYSVSEASCSIFGGTYADHPSVHPSTRPDFLQRIITWANAIPYPEEALPSFAGSAISGSLSNIPIAEPTYLFSSLFTDVDLELEFSNSDDGGGGNLPLPSPVILQHEGTEYKILGELGRGSFGRVILASTNDGNDVAIKVLSKAAGPRCLENHKTSILNEKQILARISEEEDPFITTLLASFQDEDNIYFVMPRYTKTLSQVILDAQEEGFCFSPSQLKVWAAELVLGLTMLDDLHMVHRDLKPDNILVSPTGHLAIADFGFAKHFSAKTWPTAKMTQAMGTPGYFPPEMFSKDLHAVGYTSSVDRWGLGMILLEMFLGEHYAYGYSVAAAERANEHILEHVHLVIRKSVDDDIAGDLLHKLLSADGADRPSWDQIRAHEYFADVDWSSIQNRTYSEALPKPTVGHVDSYQPIRVPYGAPKIEVRDASINYQCPAIRNSKPVASHESSGENS